jgi:hypothetical protein
VIISKETNKQQEKERALERKVQIFFNEKTVIKLKGKWSNKALPCPNNTVAVLKALSFFSFSPVAGIPMTYMTKLRDPAI